MGKYSAEVKGMSRRTALAGVIAAGATLGAAAPALAAPVQIPGTAIVIDVPGADAWPGYEAIAPTGGADVQAAAALNPFGYERGQVIVDTARTKLGAPYVWGATGPNAFDCSGFTSWVYSQVGVSIPRTSYAQAASGTPVAKSDLQAGDIVAFYSGASHVGIYSGHGTVIHALTEGTPLSETPLDSMPFHSATRY